MAKVAYTGSVTGFRGKIGNLIFRQMPNGTIVVSAAPAKKTGRQKKRAKLRRSPKQKAHNSRFREAVTYAKVAQTHPFYVELAAVTPMMTAYNFALKDWLNAPVVHSVEREQGWIRIQASDVVLVTKVQVTVLDENGSVLEKGDAIRSDGDWWEFASEAQGKTIIAEAWDLPGHVTKLLSELANQEAA